MHLSNIKNIIWDFNGTLLNDLEICLASINPLLKARNLPEIDKISYQKVFTFPVIEYYKAIGFNLEKEDFEIPAIQFIDNYRLQLPHAALFEGIKDLLHNIKLSGKKQVILSAMEEPFLKDTVCQLQIQEYFIEVAGIQDHYAHSKVERGKKLLKNQNFVPSETLLVGDTLHDYEVAEALGVQCLLISHGHQSQERLRINGNVVVKSVRELEKLLMV